MEADAHGGEPVTSGDFPGKMFAANDGPEIDKWSDSDLSARAVLTAAGTSRRAVCIMQQDILCAFMETPRAVSVSHADIAAAPEAGLPAQQGILQGFGGMSEPKRLRLIAAVRNILKNTFTILLIPGDFTAVKIKYMEGSVIFRNTLESRSRQTRTNASFMRPVDRLRPSAWCMNASRRVIAPACSFPSYDMEIYGNPS